MNYLAHIYLSGINEQVVIGNFIADGIKGKKYQDFPKDIKKGILLHRQIDSYTDSHPIVKSSTKRLHKHYGHYAGVIVDIFYDHFLAKNWSNYCRLPLDEYVENFYTLLKANFDVLPLRIQTMMPYMIEDNWLLSYASIQGIQKVLDGVNKRTNNISKMNLATKELTIYYDEFEAEFANFFEELINFSSKTLDLLSSQD